MFVKVAVNIPTEKTFTYRVPEDLQPNIAVGKRVLIPFGRRLQTGYVLDILTTTDDENIKDIRDISDPEPLFDASELDFYRWIADYYVYPLGKALGDILPGEDQKSIRRLSMVDGGPDIPPENLSALQEDILAALRSASTSDGLSMSHLKRRFNHPDFGKSIRDLERMGLVRQGDHLHGRAATCKTEKRISLAPDRFLPEKLTEAQTSVIGLVRTHGELSLPRLLSLSGKGRSVVATLIRKGILAVREVNVLSCADPVAVLGQPGESFQPNPDQLKALEGIKKGLQSGRFSPCLLHGVTGSGKTEVYFLAIEEVLRKNGGVLFLVPEIGLTPQLLGRFHERFPGEPIAVLHSGISSAMRYDQWRCIQRGDIRVVVGARSALFSPLRNLRLVIIDEEHDESYKQDDRMRYNARDLALVKGRMHQATVILGSATPAIQSYFNALSGKYDYFSLPSRVEDRPLPQIEIVDMRWAENGDGGKDASPILSRRLKEAMRETLQARKQALLLLNRRGFSTIVLCRDCGNVLKCRNCDLTLTLHAREKVLTCHYCDFTLEESSVCPVCGGSRMAGYGVGTERLEEQIRLTFPDARVARMDRDTTARVGAHEGILRALAEGEIDILVGTQMISKGHDFPNVVLVGVLSADISLNIPDFRASEKTFQLLTQVSGRGGRGDSPGRVVIQTFNPGHYVLKRVQDHDYRAFYNEEVALRQSLAYPPYSRMIGLHISCIDRDKGWREAQTLGAGARDLIKEAGMAGNLAVIGPAEAPLARIRGRYRWQLLLKGGDSRLLRHVAQNLLSRYAASGIQVKIDVDPMNFM